ncbi:MAG: murein transglycosylase [Rhodobacterales bacterium]|nr:MAG: murein transglycosylase [Rhodobacterales bacterium]
MAEIGRRQLTFGLTAFGLGCGCRAGLAASAGEPPEPRPDRRSGGPPKIRPKPRPDPGFHAWVAGFRRRALAEGIAPATFDRAFANVQYLSRVTATDRAQTAPRRPLEAYIARAASPERLRIGAAKLKRHRRLFDRLEARFGVPREVLAAIWGMESGFGAMTGKTPVISALATLAFEARRASYFEGELLAALRIVEAGDTGPGPLRGSWAGAMGHMQFMPSTWLAHGVDFDGDGRRDIRGEDPADALASAANYLSASGWVAGAPWGLQVRLPGGRDPLATRSVAEWRARGVTRVGGGAVPDHGAAELILPDGAGGPAFLLFANTRVLRAYNDSIKYALGVGHLADRLGGGKPLAATRAELDFEARQALQTRLTRAGFDTGGADGVFGHRTTAAIRAWEAAEGLPVTGVATRAALERLGG